MTNLRKFFDERPWLTQRGVADKAGISESDLSRYCNGLRPSIETKEKIVIALAVCTGQDLTVADLWPEPERTEA
jgi:transcriptional regulator with XRE-family HTH domain